MFSTFIKRAYTARVLACHVDSTNSVGEDRGKGTTMRERERERETREKTCKRQLVLLHTKGLSLPSFERALFRAPVRFLRLVLLSLRCDSLHSSGVAIRRCFRNVMLGGVAREISWQR